jgi:hypothetical protein
LLEPTQAPRMKEPGACAHARRGGGLGAAGAGRWAGGRPLASGHARGRTRRSWRKRTHHRGRWWSQRSACQGWSLDCSTPCTGLFGSCPRRPRRPPALLKERGVFRRPPTAHISGFRLAWVCSFWLTCAVGFSSGRPSKTWCLASSNMLHAFALSSAWSWARKPPESERCTTCRRVVDGFRRLAYTHGGGTVPSQGMCTQGFSGFVKTGARLGCVEPLSHWTKVERVQVVRRMPTMCNPGRITQRASGCAAQSVSTHL